VGCFGLAEPDESIACAIAASRDRLLADRGISQALHSAADHRMISRIGLRDCGTAGLRDCGTAGLPDCGTAGLPDCGTAGLRDCGTAERTTPPSEPGAVIPPGLGTLADRRDRDASFSTGAGSGDVGSPTEDAELVALGVDQHNPALFALADIQPSRAERLESGDLLVAVAPDGADV